MVTWELAATSSSAFRAQTSYLLRPHSSIHLSSARGIIASPPSINKFKSVTLFDSRTQAWLMLGGERWPAGHEIHTLYCARTKWANSTRYEHSSHSDTLPTIFDELWSMIVNQDPTSPINLDSRDHKRNRARHFDNKFEIKYEEEKKIMRFDQNITLVSRKQNSVKRYHFSNHLKLKAHRKPTCIVPSTKEKCLSQNHWQGKN
jgi:hypothetical protein